MPSILRPWVEALSIRCQGTIITALRGCDLTPKTPHDSPERELVAYLRYLTLNPADYREIGHDGAFMQDCGPRSWKPSQLQHYPTHWYAHLMHAYEIVGYFHPDFRKRRDAFAIYRTLVESLHLQVESQEALMARMDEDRIATGNIVS